jgi:Secretion system C-terminal sorting domain
MKFNILVLTILLLPVTTISQDRGCPGSSYYFSIQTNDSTFYQDDDVNYYWYYPTGNDTMVVQLYELTDVTISWGFMDNQSGNYSKSIQWFQDERELDKSYFDFTVDSMRGDCYNPTGNTTSLTTSESGIYQFKMYNHDFTSRWIKIEYINPPGPAPILELIVTPEFSLFPNPTSEILSINHGNVSNGGISVMDFQGKVVIQKTIGEKVKITRLDVHDLRVGTYFIKLQTNLHGIVTKKFVVIE